MGNWVLLTTRIERVRRRADLFEQLTFCLIIICVACFLRYLFVCLFV